MQISTHVIRQFLLVSLLFPAVAFGHARENPEKVSLQLQWRHQFEFAGFYVAKEKGYYAKAGLEVEIREYQQDRDIIALVLSGKASFGTLYTSPILARMEGKPVILAANYFKRSPLAFVVQPDIYFPGDLKGKRVMGEKQELESANFSQMFRQFNMTPEDFTIVPHTFNIDKFINKEVDAMTVFLTNEVFHLRQKKVPFNIIDPNNYGIPFYDVTLFTSQSLADSKPETVAAFIKASNKGWQYALKYPEEVVDLILAKYNSQNKTKAHLLFEADRIQRMVQPDIYPIGSIDPARIKRIEELFVSEGVAPTIVAPEDFIFGLRKRERLDLTSAEQNFIRNHPTIKIIKSFHQPPFTIHEGNSVTGYLHDLLSETLKMAGLKAQYVPAGDTFDDMVEAIQNGRALILPNMNSTRKLSDLVARTAPVITTPNALVGKVTAAKVKVLSDLFGVKVAVVKGYAQDQHLNRFPQIHKVHVANNDEGFEAVRMGKADYFLNNLANSAYIIQKSFATDLRICGELPYDVFPPLSLCFAVSRKYSKLASIIQKSLVAIPIETRMRLRQKWLGENSEPGRKIKDSQTLIVDFQTRPPHMIIKGDAPFGPMVEILQEVTKKLGYTINWQFRPFEKSIEALKSGQTDMVPRVYRQKDLEAYADFIGPIADETKRVQFIIRTNGKQLKRYEDLKNITIAVKKKESYFERFDADESLHKVVAANEIEQIQLFKDGKVDVVAFCEDAIVTDAIKALQLEAYQIAPFVHEQVVGVYYAMSKQSPFIQLAEPIQQEIMHLKKSGGIQKIYAGYKKERTGFLLSEEELRYLDGKGPIRMCSAPRWPPIEWIDEHNRHQGISAEFMGVIAQRIGHTFELVPAKTWNETIENLKSKNCDFISTITKTDERSKDLNLTEHYQELDVVIATRKEQIYIQNLDTLAGQKIGVVKDSVYQTLIEKQHPGLEIVPVNDIFQGLYMVQDGSLSGLVDNLISLAFAIQQKGLVDIKISGRVGEPVRLCMGIHKDEPMLYQILSRALASISQQQRQKFASKWIAVKFEQAVDYTLLWKVVAATALIILGIVLWNRKLAAFNQKVLKAKEELEQSNLVAEKAKAAAEKADQAKSLFLANMSHELRTPLNAILGFSELMQRDPDITPALSNHIETINRSGEHLLALINDVLELSKIDAGSVILTPGIFDLHRLLASLEEMFRLRAQEKGLSLVFACAADVPRYIYADESKLRQILINLLGNAVKFTESGEVMLRLMMLEPCDKGASKKCFLRFEVKDTGPGIAAEEQEKIFDAFFQAGKEPSSRQGTGLGLPISRKFVGLMGAELTVASKVGMGTCFSFELSVECASGQQVAFSGCARKVVALEADQPAYRLLVAEDNQQNRSLMVTLLKTVGFEVQEAVNGKQAVEIWEKWKPHFIWMDMRMPIMDGYQATRQIKALPAGENTAIIALTASAFEEDRLKVIEHGCDDFVRKPCKASEVFEMIKKHLGVRYVYAEDEADLASRISKPKGSGESMAGGIKDLDKKLVARLKEATELSDAAMIDKVIEEIRIENSQLAEALSELAGNFDYDKILSLIHPDGMQDNAHSE